MNNPTDARILKLYNQGLTLERIAQRIGRPGDIERVRIGIRRELARGELIRRELGKIKKEVFP